MKILQLIDSLNIGGAERMSVNIANVLSENKIESYLVTSRNSGPLHQFLLPQVKFYHLNKKSGLDILVFYRFLKLAKNIKPNIIHAHSTSVYWALGVKLFMPKIKVVWHDHYGLSDSLKDGDRFWHRFLSKWIDAVIVVNDLLENWCRKNLKLPVENIFYLNNFPHLTIIQKESESKKNILLNLANFRPQKDQLILLDAVKIVKDAGINFELMLAGAYVDQNWVTSVKERIENLGLQNDVEILGPVENSATILAKASIGILSSNSEGLPVTLLEYGLAGLPVICTDTGQCKEVLGNGKYGIVVPPSDSIALGDAIIELITNSTAAEQMALAFNKHVMKEYGSEKFLVGYLKMLNSII